MSKRWLLLCFVDFLYTCHLLTQKLSLNFDWFWRLIGNGFWFRSTCLSPYWLLQLAHFRAWTIHFIIVVFNKNCCNIATLRKSSFILLPRILLAVSSCSTTVIICYSLTQGERLSHAVGCAFAICLEKKQKRERDAVQVSHSNDDAMFARMSSFRQVYCLLKKLKFACSLMCK